MLTRWWRKVDSSSEDQELSNHTFIDEIFWKFDNWLVNERSKLWTSVKSGPDVFCDSKKNFIRHKTNQPALCSVRPQEAAAPARRGKGSVAGGELPAQTPASKRSLPESRVPDAVSADRTGEGQRRSPRLSPTDFNPHRSNSDSNHQTLLWSFFLKNKKQLCPRRTRCFCRIKENWDGWVWNKLRDVKEEQSGSEWGMKARCHLHRPDRYNKSRN